MNLIGGRVLYNAGKNLCNVLLRSLYRIDIRGTYNIPDSGAVMLCANHISNLDPILMGIASPRKIHYMAKDELFRIPFLAVLLRVLGAFPVRRGKADRAALRTGIDLLKAGNVLGLFPEGTRSRNGKLGKAHSGVAYFALRTNCRVVPVAISGSYRLFSRISIAFGESVNVSDLSTNESHIATGRIMNSIEAMLLSP